jgi:hypothetical protein
MTTAREQARQAADRRAGGLAVQGSESTAISLAADAASDVWEPLLREVTHALKELSDSFNTGVYDDLFHRVREALG